MVSAASPGERPAIDTEPSDGKGIIRFQPQVLNLVFDSIAMITFR
jgi:hypothetical protein